MPGSYHFEGAILSIAMECEHTPKDFLEILSSALSDQKCPGKVDLLINSSRASFNPTPDQLRELVARMAKFEKLGRRALVANTDFFFGLGRMAGAFEELQGKEMLVFKTVDEAKKWLLEG